MADSFSSPTPPAPQSMESIMASIKRIIHEPAPVPVEPPPVTAAPEEEILELGWPHVTVRAPLPDPQPAPPLAEATRDAAPLVSAATREASARAMATLATVAIDPNAPPNTIDGLIREMLRPMLREWLDANLPDLVERVVAREVARLGG